MYLTGLELAGIIIGAMMVGAAIGLFIMAAMVVGGEERQDDGDE